VIAENVGTEIQNQQKTIIKTKT